MSQVHATAFPDALEVARGDAGVISVAISNTSDVIDAYEVQVFGLDPEWLEITPPRLSLFPGVTDNVDIRVMLPDDYPSSSRTLAVNVVSEDDPSAFTLSQVQLSVAPLTVTSIELDPSMLTGGAAATFGIVVSNLGNSAVKATGFAIDPEDLAEFTFDPPAVFVAPGQEQVIQVTAEGGRAWFGQAKARTFTMGVDAERRVEAFATFVQRPRISRWLIALLGLLTAAAVFAVVLSRTFDNVVNEVRTDDAVLDAALGDGDTAGLLVPTDPAVVTGAIVSATTGDGLPGIQAELFAVKEPSEPVATGATSDGGEFSFPGLGPGDYLLRFSGAGIVPVWYGPAFDAADAEPIAVQRGQPLELEPVVVGGIPVEVAGQVEVATGVDLTGTTISLVVPGVTDPKSDAVVATSDIAIDGSFALDGVPSPGTYQMVVQQPGAAPTIRDVVLQPGEDLGGIEVSVVAGAGVITGLVSDAGGPLGGATVIATDGSTEIQTVTLTEGEKGTFTLRNLPTPAQYTVTMESDGLTTEARTVALDESQPEGRVTASLVAAVGSVQGNAVVAGDVARGLEVTISGGDVNITKPIVSQGSQAGSYTFAQLPSPATYTLTFTGENVLPQVRVVDIDARTGNGNVTGVDVSLARETTLVGGIVRGPNGQPEPRATVTLSDGSTEFTFPTADDPAGQFEFGTVPPGSYTLTASRPGTEPAVVIVTVAATEAPPFYDLTLGEQASFSGRVVDKAGAPLAGRTVRLFEPAQFPNGTELATTTTDAQGGYRFDGLSAPESFMIAVYTSSTAANPVDSTVVRTIPSQNVVVVDLLGETP